MIPGLMASPAFNGAGSGGAGASALTFTFVASGTSDTSTITIPGSAVAGDFAILFDAALEHTGGSVSSVVPSGWTSIVDTYATAGSYAIRSLVSYRKLTAAGGGSITGMNSDGESKVMLIFRPSTSILTTVVSTWNAEMTSGNPVLQTVTTVGIATPLIVFAWASKQGTSSSPAFVTETPSMTNVTNTGAGDDPGARLGYTIYNTSPADQTIDTADNGGMNGLQSGYVRFT